MTWVGLNAPEARPGSVIRWVGLGVKPTLALKSLVVFHSIPIIRNLIVESDHSYHLVPRPYHPPFVRSYHFVSITPFLQGQSQRFMRNRRQWTCSGRAGVGVGVVFGALILFLYVFLHIQYTSMSSVRIFRKRMSSKRSISVFMPRNPSFDEKRRNGEAFFSGRFWLLLSVLLVLP